MKEEGISALVTGPGWRVGWQPIRDPFPGLIGGDEWALELTSAEWYDFHQGCLTVQQSMAESAAILMAEESITLEHLTPLLRLILTGSPQSGWLYCQLQTGRRGEGQWSVAATASLLAHMQALGG